MRRRSILKYLATTAAMQTDLLRWFRAQAATTPAFSRARPGMPDWPTEADWASLKRAVGDRLDAATLADVDDPATRKLIFNPFYIGDYPALTQSSGWLDAWQSSPSAFVVAAESAADIAAAVRFASAHNLRLVVKGGGHSYLGASNAPDSRLDPAHERHHPP